ncbi:MAG: ABC transporter ATP-binding protein/permease, partial [Clostridiales bacterium]|nr:ABC transporter ATP-binding protein/permease [Clostridiales bacterium]
QTYDAFKKDLIGLALACVLTVIVSSCVALTPLVPQLIIDRVLNPALGNQPVYANNLLNFFIDGFQPDDFWGMFIVLSVVFFSIILIKLVCNYSRWQIAQFFGTRAETRIRDTVFRKIMAQNSVVLSRYTSGELLNIANSDIGSMKEFFTTQIIFLFNIFVILSINIYLLSNMHPVLIIIPLVGGFSTLIFARLLSNINRRQHQDIRQARVKLTTTVQENIQGVRVVRSYAAEDIELNKFDKVNDNLRNNFVIHARTQAKFTVIFSIISQLIFFGSMVVGVFLAVNGEISVGQFATIFVYTMLISDPFTTLSNVIAQYQNAKIAAGRVFGFLNIANDIVDGSNPVKLSLYQPHIKVDDIAIEIDGKILIKNFSVDLPYGKHLGIMGKTGSGKTAFIKSLMRFFDTTQGNIFLNNTSIKQYKVNDIRKVFGYVMQDLFLFSDSVQKNIAFFEPECSLEKVMESAKIAQAHDFIEKLTEGYQTIVGDKGVGLSGGQKQRVSMARAFLKDAPILLFDDCTSALDMDTERQIMQNINDSFAGKSIVIATHRASSVKNCDEILYLDDGEILERGTHNQLMELKGKYFEIFTSQQAMQDDMTKN